MFFLVSKSLEKNEDSYDSKSETAQVKVTIK